MLKAYFDDSSSENADGAHRSVFVLAGFMSTAERWAVFDEEWNEVLNDLPERKRGGPKRLKMSQAMSARSRGPINRAVWDPRFAKIEAIIARHAEVGFGCIIDLDAFKEVRRCDPMIDAIKSAYRVAFLGIIGATVRYHCEQGITDKVDFVFDDQGADFDRAYDCFQHVRRTDPYLTDLIVAGSPRSGTDDQILPLQAADRLVWQLRFHFARTNAEKGISANEDKLFITAVPTFPAQADGPPILVDIWDSARLSECHSANRESFREIYRKHFPGFETTDFADEMKERIRQLLPYRF